MYLRLIRLPNLIILAMGMYLMRLMVVEPLLILSREAPQVTSFNFFLIVMATVLIAAGGYIINDIEDVEMDEVNRPGKVVINKKLSNDNAWNLYLLLTFAGVCMGFYLTFMESVRYVAYIEIIAAGLLYFYSTTYKRMILLGNIVVAGLTSLAIALPYITEPASQTVAPLKQLVLGYIIYAFFISLVREVIKDIQDIKGDKIAGCKTLPIVAGITFSKSFAAIVVILLTTGLILLQLASRQWEAIISFIYVIVLIQIPLILLLVSIIISSTSDDFARSSMLAKLIMVTGLLSMPVFYYSFN